MIDSISPQGDGSREWINFSSYQNVTSSLPSSSEKKRTYSRNISAYEVAPIATLGNHPWYGLSGWIKYSSYEDMGNSLSFIEKQHYMLACGLGMSLFSPYTVVYQLCQLHPHRAVTPYKMLRLSAQLLPVQISIRYFQVNFSAPLKEYLSPWVSFALVGVMQIAVYCHSNMHFSRALGIVNAANQGSALRGIAFGAPRDIFAQAGPFLCSDSVREYIIDRIIPSEPTYESRFSFANQLTAVMASSVASTYITQCLHNCHSTMQKDQSLDYINSMRVCWQRYGMAAFYRGAERRMGVLMAMNTFNELLLKPSWRGEWVILRRLLFCTVYFCCWISNTLIITSSHRLRSNYTPLTTQRLSLSL